MIIEVFDGIRYFEYSVGIRAIAMRLSQIASFFICRRGLFLTDDIKGVYLCG